MSSKSLMEILLSENEEASIIMKVMEFLNKDVEDITYNDIRELKKIQKQSKGEMETKYGSHFVMCEGPYVKHGGPVIVNEGKVKEHLSKIADVSRTAKTQLRELERMGKESKFYYYDLSVPVGDLAYHGLRLYDISMALYRILTIGSLLFHDWKRKQENHPDYRDTDEEKVIEEIRQLGVTFRYPKTEVG